MAKNYFEMIKRKKGYDIRGTLMMIVMLIIVATGIASSIAIDIFLSKSVSKDEYKYEIQMLKIKRGLNRFLYSGEWAVATNTDIVTRDLNLGDKIKSFYPSQAPIYATYEVMVSYNTKNQQIYFGDHTYAQYFDSSYSHYGSKTNRYMDDERSYRINTIKFLRRLISLGYLSMSKDEIENPSVLGYCGRIVDSRLTYPVWTAGKMEEITTMNEDWLDANVDP